MRRKVTASRDMERKLLFEKKKEVYSYSFFPIDKHDCPCQKEIEDYREEMTAMHPSMRSKKMESDKPLKCPRGKDARMKQYKIVCNNCGAIQGYVKSIDESLSDWCDFHYVTWSNGKEWFGCFTPHISPIDGQLCFECTCGNDSRDFRANTNLPSMVAYQKELSNRRGRRFGQPNSKFRLELVNGKEVRFN